MTDRYRGKHDLIIRNGTIVTGDGVFQGDIAVQGGRIVSAGDHLPQDTNAETEIDAMGLHILPGVVDSHVHCNEPGRTDWEGFATASQSMACGGTTTFLDMPLNSTPPTTTAAAFDRKRSVAERASIIDFGLWGGLAPGNVNQLEALHTRGAVGFKAFMSNSGIDDFPLTDDETLIEGMYRIAQLGSILAVHAENEVLTTWLAARSLAEGCRSATDFCASRPVGSEIEAVRRAGTYAEATGCRLHILHVSSGHVAEEVTVLRTYGADITVETCPHYLALREEDFEILGGVAKCAPPLRSPQHVESLWQALSSGLIDTVGSDHSPAPPAMKVAADGDMFTVWGGISGAQTLLAVLLTEGYWRRGVPLETIARVASTNPARRFGLYPRKGTIAGGSDADLCLVDLDYTWRLEHDDLRYRHRQSPFAGRTFRGRVVQTLVRGKTVFRGGDSGLLRQQGCLVKPEADTSTAHRPNTGPIP